MALPGGGTTTTTTSPTTYTTPTSTYNAPGTVPGETDSTTALYQGPTPTQYTTEQLRYIAPIDTTWNPQIITYEPQPTPPPPTSEIGTVDGILGQMAATPTSTNTSQYDPYLVARLDEAVRIGAMSAETASGILQGTVRTSTSGSNLTPFPYQPFGTASIGGMDAASALTGGGLLGGGLGDTTGVLGSQNEGGLLGGFESGGGPLSGSGLTAGFNASPDATGFGVNTSVTSGFDAGALNTALGDAVSIGAMSPAQAEAIATGAAAAAATGSSTGTGTGDSGFGDGSIGGIADGSSNAGLGGPAGTGAVGGIGAAAGAGAGTGGVGEGEQFGNQFVVGGRGGVDSMPVNFRATPGELVTVTPPGRGFGPRDARGNNRQSGIGELEAILRYMAAGRGG